MSPGPFPSRPVVVRLVLVAWAALMVAALVMGAERIGHPFPGFILTDNLYLGATDLADWTGPKAGLTSLDHVVAVDGRPVASAIELIDRVRQAPVGTAFRYTLADGRTVTVPSMAFTAWEYMRSIFPFWIAAVVHLAFGGWVLLQRPRSPAAIGHWRYCQVFALFMVGAVIGEHRPFWNAVNLIGCGLLLPGFIELMLGFPVGPGDPRLERLVRRSAWAAGAGIAAVVLVSLGHDPLFPLAFNLVLAMPIVALMATLGLWAWQAYFSHLAPAQRGQARMALLGLGISLGPSVVYATAAQLKVPLPGFEFAFMGFCAFPAAIALAIVRYQAFDLNYVLRQATLYTLLTAALGGVYLAAALVGHLSLGQLAPTVAGASVPGFLAALAVAAAFRPWHAALQRWVDRWFLGDRVDPLGAVAAFSADTERLEADALAAQLVSAVRHALQATWVELRWDGRVLSDGERPPGEVPAAEVMIRPQEGPVGSLEVGPRRDDAPYGAPEQALLEVLARQAALAFDRALLFESRLRLGLREATALGRAEARELLLKQVVHDLGTELSNIAVSADLARQLPGEAGPLDSIQASLSRIEQFLAEKRRRLQQGGPDETPLGAGLEAAFATLTPQLALKRQRMETRVADPGLVVPLSEVELAQVVVNVVGNASKFSPAGAAIRLAAAQADQQVVIRVEDEGPGVPGELLDTPGDGRRGAPETPGSGLGLGNCRALVTAAGGTLEWYNGERGAVVELRLPVVRSSPVPGS